MSSSTLSLKCGDALLMERQHLNVVGRLCEGRFSGARECLDAFPELGHELVCGV
mgnify:CR=1 FL=1